SPWVRVAGTIGGIALLFHTVDMGGAASSLRNADPRWIAAALSLSAVAVAASVVEWGVLIRVATSPAQHSNLTWRRLSSSYLQSLFFSQLLPAGVGGDAARTVEMGRSFGYGRVLASLAGSRMAGMLGMACWGLAGTIMLREGLGNGILAMSAILAALIVVIWTGALSADHLV